VFATFAAFSHSAFSHSNSVVPLENRHGRKGFNHRALSLDTVAGGREIIKLLGLTHGKGSESSHR
jgi:hypothetical protein